MNHSDVFHADRHLKKIDNRLTFDVRYCNSQDINEHEMGRAFIICF